MSSQPGVLKAYEEQRSLKAIAREAKQARALELVRKGTPDRVIGLRLGVVTGTVTAWRLAAGLPAGSDEP